LVFFIFLVYLVKFCRLISSRLWVNTIVVGYIVYSSFFLFVFVCQCLFTFSLVRKFMFRIWFHNADTSILDRLIPWAIPETYVLSRIMPFCVIYFKMHDAAWYINFVGPRQIRPELPFLGIVHLNGILYKMQQCNDLRICCVFVTLVTYLPQRF